MFENWFEFIIVKLLYCKNKYLNLFKLANELFSINEILLLDKSSENNELIIEN